MAGPDLVAPNRRPSPRVMPLASEAVSEKPGGEPRWVCLDPPPGDVITQSRALIVLPRLFPEMWEAGGPHVGPPDGGTAGFPSPDPAWDPDASLEREPTRRRTAEKAVLVADDDFDTREMLQAALQLWGYRALLAADGVAALAETRATSPDLILLDLLMPELDGWAVLANLRLDPRTRPIPVVVISAVSRRGLAEEVLAAGANAFVEKPFDIDVLETIIRRLLEQH